MTSIRTRARTEFACIFRYSPSNNNIFVLKYKVRVSHRRHPTSLLLLLCFFFFFLFCSLLSFIFSMKRLNAPFLFGMSVNMKFLENCVTFFGSTFFYLKIFHVALMSFVFSSPRQHGTIFYANAHGTHSPKYIFQNLFLKHNIYKRHLDSRKKHEKSSNNTIHKLIKTKMKEHRYTYR